MDISQIIEEIPELTNITHIQKINEGWSADKKFKISTKSGTCYLLRVSSSNELDRKQEEYAALKAVSTLGINTSVPVAFGTFSDGSVYTVLTWVNGQPAEKVLHTLPIQKQYELGFQAGQMLYKIHSLEVTVDSEQEKKYSEKLDRSLNRYKDCPYKFEHDKTILDFIEEHRHLLKNRPTVLHHGDFHIGNMVISDDHEIGLIDYNRTDKGDPYEEFDRMIWNHRISEEFATGIVDGYFEGNPTDEFFQIMAFYTSRNILGSIPWAIPFGEKETQVMLQNAEEIFRSYSGFTTIYPSWYRRF